MRGIIDDAFSRTRFVGLALLMILAVGAYAYVSIPKESSPEIPIPFVYVFTTLDGIPPEDAERLLVEPMETEFGALTGLKKMEASASEGYASVLLEFEPGGDVDEALDRVREVADRAAPELPEDASEPVVVETNTALFPILTAILSGPVPERTLNRIADELQDRIEAVPGVLEAEIGGERTEVLEVEIDPTVFETYNISFEELIGQINRNNRLVAAGAIENGAGRIVLKVPGLIEDIGDVMALPVKVRGDTVVTFGDVATIRRTFEDPTGFARIDGQPALALEVKKRAGSNIIETVAAVKQAIEEEAEAWPDSVTVNYMQDESEQVKTMLSDLESNVIAAIVLVMIVIVWALGLRSAILVGLAIPGAFLAGVAVLWFMGYTMNIIVLFSLILVVGHAGRRRDRHHRARRPQAAGGHGAARGLRLRRQAHGLGDHRLDADDALGVLSAPVLAGHGRRVHEVPADHGDPDAHRLALHGADLHPGHGRDHRTQAAADGARQGQAARRRDGRPARYSRSHRRLRPPPAMGDPEAGNDADAGHRLPAGRVQRLRAVRQRDQLLSGDRARFHAGRGPCPRQTSRSSRRTRWCAGSRSGFMITMGSPRSMPARPRAAPAARPTRR